MQNIKSCTIYLVCGLALVTIHACHPSIKGEGELSIETRNLSAYSKLEVDLDANVILTDSLVQSCMISAQENLMPAIETRIKGERLIIYSENNIHNDKPITVYLSVNRLQHIILNGSGIVTGTNILKSEKLDIDVSGSGDLNLSLLCNQLKATISGSGTQELKGSSNESDFEISGSGVIDAFQFATGDCNVDIAGSGKALVFPSGVLNAEISGSGKIQYKGNPSDIKHSISGSGNIEKSE